MVLIINKDIIPVIPSKQLQSFDALEHFYLLDLIEKIKNYVFFYR